MSGFFAPQFQNSARTVLNGSGVSSGSGSGGSSAPAGGGSSPSVAVPPAPPPGGLGTYVFQLILTAATALGLPASVWRGPAFNVQPGMTVFLAPRPGNVATVYVGLNGAASAVSAPPGLSMPMAPTSQPVQISVQNLAEIWVSGTVADGLQIIVRRG